MVSLCLGTESGIEAVYPVSVSVTDGTARESQENVLLNRCLA